MDGESGRDMTCLPALRPRPLMRAEGRRSGILLPTQWGYQHETGSYTVLINSLQGQRCMADWQA